MLNDLPQLLNFIVFATLIGIGATAVMDIWALFLKKTFNIIGLDYAMVGRWIGHMPNGRISHKGIKNSGAIRGEAIIGWTAHYLIGIVFAAALLLIWGISWVENPSLIPAVTIGLSSLVFPLFIMQPCFGMGVAASKLPKPHIARLKSLMAHFTFGLGLYISAVVLKQLM